MAFKGLENLTPEQLLALAEATDAQWKRDAEKMEDEFTAALRIAVDKVSNHGWTLPPSTTAYMIGELSVMPDDDIDAFFQIIYAEEEVFKKFLEVAESSTIDTGKKKAFLDSVKAYQYHLYVPAAVTLCAIIEGVLSTFNHGNPNTTKMRATCKAYYDAVPQDDIISKALWASYLAFVEKLFKDNEKGKGFEGEPEDFPGRNWLLHGRSKYEVDQVDCLKLICAFFTIVEIYDESKE